MSLILETSEGESCVPDYDETTREQLARSLAPRLFWKTNREWLAVKLDRWWHCASFFKPAWQFPPLTAWEARTIKLAWVLVVIQVSIGEIRGTEDVQTVAISLYRNTQKCLVSLSLACLLTLRDPSAKRSAYVLLSSAQCHVDFPAACVPNILEDPTYGAIPRE